MSPEREERAFEALLNQEVARPAGLMRASITRARNEMMYSRPAVVTVPELRQFFAAASRVLPALQEVVERRLAGPALLPAGAWAIPESIALG